MNPLLLHVPRIAKEIAPCVPTFRNRLCLAARTTLASDGIQSCQRFQYGSSTPVRRLNASAPFSKTSLDKRGLQWQFRRYASDRPGPHSPQSPPETPRETTTAELPPETIAPPPPRDAPSGPLRDDTDKPSSPPPTSPPPELPSTRARQRHELSKRLATLVDSLTEKLAIAGQRVNNYTGTDYSGIDALRREIKSQERIVKTHHEAVQKAKEAYDAAQQLESASKKEVVGLLERKHSWSAADLERYMSLIRSEHINEQAVLKAKEDVAAAEHALEEARTKLEKRERAQYHEEQIWSDTIRRNSTWVTFGLMGFNILLLLANLAIIEPWRRRRLVREVRAALDEKTLAPQGVASAAVEEQIDGVVEPTVPVEQLETPQSAAPAPGAADAVRKMAVEQPAPLEPTPAADEAVLSYTQEPASSPAEQPPVSDDLQATIPEALPITDLPPETLSEPIVTADRPSTIKDWFKNLKIYINDLFSERKITLRKFEITTIALEGAAVGVAFMGLVLVLLRPS